MWLYNILKNFESNTKVIYYIGQLLISDGTVAEWLDSGINMGILFNSEKDTLSVNEDHIVIRLSSSF